MIVHLLKYEKDEKHIIIYLFKHAVLKNSSYKPGWLALGWGDANQSPVQTHSCLKVAARPSHMQPERKPARACLYHQSTQLCVTPGP